MTDIGGLISVFHDVSGLDGPITCPYQVESDIFSPPSYIVELVFKLVGKFNVFSPHDKVGWTVYIKYRNFEFEVHDWKHTAWMVKVNNNSLEAIAVGRELKKKIMKVAAQLDKAIAKELKKEVASGEFILNNPYPKIWRAYDWYRERALQIPQMPAQIKAEPEIKLPKNLINKYFKSLNTYYKSLEETVFYGYALVGFYFSSVECLFNIFYAFGNRKVDFNAFRNCSWRERFQNVLPVAKDPKLKSIYDKLLHIKMDFRDELFHGFGGDENFLVQIPSLGYIPITYEALTRSVHYSPTISDKDFVASSIDVFDQFDTWLQKNYPAYCYLKYAKSGLPIPFYGGRLQEIQDIMKNPHDFEGWLENEMDQQDE